MDGVSKCVVGIENRLLSTEDFEATLGFKCNGIADCRCADRKIAFANMVSEPPRNTLNSKHAQISAAISHHNLGKVSPSHECENLEQGILF